MWKLSKVKEIKERRLTVINFQFTLPETKRKAIEEFVIELKRIMGDKRG